MPRDARALRVVEDSTAAFSGTRAPGRAPGNLPLELSSFIGREQEIAEIKRLLEDSCLVTLIGPGGCGKTRLALAVASFPATGRLVLPSSGATSCLAS